VIRNIYARPKAEQIGTVLNPTQAPTLINYDLTNSAWVGNSPSAGPNDSASIELQALTAMTVGGTGDLWIASSIAAGIKIGIAPPGTQWTPSPAQVSQQLNALGLAKDTSVQQVHTDTAAVNVNTTGVAKDATVGTVATNTGNVHTDLALGTNAYLAGTSTGALVSAAGLSVAKDMLNANSKVTTEIAALFATGLATGTPGGVPLLAGKTTLSSNTAGQVIVTASTFTLTGAPWNITQVGYEIVISLASAIATTAPLTIQAMWTDTTTGIQTETQQYNVYTGTVAAPHFFKITGPTNANQFSVKIVNAVGASVTATWVVSGVSRIYTRHDIRTIYSGGNNPVFAGFTLAIGTSLATNVLTNTRALVNLNSTSTWMLPIYSGNVLMQL
jgi:hypothetical protein